MLVFLSRVLTVIDEVGQKLTLPYEKRWPEVERGRGMNSVILQEKMSGGSNQEMLSELCVEIVVGVIHWSAFEGD